MHLGGDPVHEVQEETVQYAACAAGREVDHVLTGNIPQHLVRNVILRRNEEEVRKNREQKMVKKPPAARG